MKLRNTSFNISRFLPAVTAFTAGTIFMCTSSYAASQRRCTSERLNFSQMHSRMSKDCALNYPAGHIYVWDSEGRCSNSATPNKEQVCKNVGGGASERGATEATGSGAVSNLTKNSAPYAAMTTQARPVARKVGEYGGIGISTERGRLDNFAHHLRHVDPDAQGYIIAYGGRRGPSDEAQTRADTIRRYLVNARDIDASRLVTVDGGFREKATAELWVVPSGAMPPMASPTIPPPGVQIARPQSRVRQNRVPQKRAPLRRGPKRRSDR